MYAAPHQQAIAPWAAPVPATAAAPLGLAQQFQPTPNSGGDRSSPPPGAITRRPRIDKKTGRTGEEILVCWLTPAPPNPFGHKFQKEWRVVSNPSRAQEVSLEACAQAQKYQDEFGLNVSSAAVGASRPQQHLPHPGPKPNVDGSGLSTKDKKKIIEDWQKNVDEYNKQVLRDARAAERSDMNNTNQRSQIQSPNPGYQDAYLQQQFLQQHQRLVAGGHIIPGAVDAIARGQILPGVTQPPLQQQLYGLPQPFDLVPVPTSGGGGIPTSTGGIIYGGPQQQQQQQQPHEAQQPPMYQGQPFSSHMDSHQSYSGSSSRAPLNPGADRGGAESDYELLHPPKRPPQQHEPQWQQLQGQQQQHQVRQGQYGPPFTPQGRFEPFIVIPDLNAPGEFPRIPRVLGEMRVRHEEWTAFMQEIQSAWQDRIPVPGKYRPASRQVSEIVDKWNVVSFKPLGVDVAFFRGQKRKSGEARTQYDTINDQLPFLDRAAPLDDDDDSSDDDDDDDDDDDEGGASVLGLRSQITQNSILSGGKQISAVHMLQLEEMRRERRRVLEEKRLAKINSRQYEPAHSIAVFPVIPT